MATVTDTITAQKIGTAVGGYLWGVVTGLVSFGRKKPLGGISLLFLVGLVTVAVFADQIAQDPFHFDRPARLAGPSWDHWLGADSFGRDTFSRLVVGSRIALIVSFSSVGFGAGVGTFIGLTSGYFGGKFDLIVQRFVDFLIAMPGLVVALVLVAVLGRSLMNVIFAVAVLSIPGTARIVRALALSLNQTEFIMAARAVGASTPRILLRHFFPQVIPLVLIAASGGLGGAILAEASLSFLGLGPAPPTPTWGAMLSGSAIQFIDESIWIVVFPGVALTLTVLFVNLLGDALRDVLDPRLRT